MQVYKYCFVCQQNLYLLQSNSSRFLLATNDYQVHACYVETVLYIQSIDAGTTIATRFRYKIFSVEVRIPLIDARCVLVIKLQCYILRQQKKL